MPARSGSQGLGAHQSLDAMQAARDSLGQHVVPHPPGAIGAVGRHETRPHLRAQHSVAARPRARRAAEPCVEPGTRHTQRFAQPCHLASWCHEANSLSDTPRDNALLQLRVRDSKFFDGPLDCRLGIGRVHRAYVRNWRSLNAVDVPPILLGGLLRHECENVRWEVRRTTRS